ncbi:hypothetical protein COHA_002840 [Chlorella ohadii]|uniref:Uncharacterized protein n=1 Tax=Chlorella ohadii TaxID=2649997 RepID=A0AAD5DWB7_9CHLO|nr:hypothetical protein COHA_002840 [Chlorella ohadii]
MAAADDPLALTPVLRLLEQKGPLEQLQVEPGSPLEERLAKLKEEIRDIANDDIGRFASLHGVPSPAAVPVGESDGARVANMPAAEARDILQALKDRLTFWQLDRHLMKIHMRSIRQTQVLTTRIQLGMLIAAVAVCGLLFAAALLESRHDRWLAALVALVWVSALAQMPTAWFNSEAWTLQAVNSANASMSKLRASASAAQQPGGLVPQLQAAGLQQWAQVVEAVLANIHADIDQATIEFIATV